MKTADFLPVEAFEAHLERRRTPRRLGILSGFLVGCLVLGLVVSLEAQHQREVAETAEAPNAVETQAGQELESLYKDMSSYVSRLDPLSDHLRMPAVGSILAELASAVGEFVQIEKIEWAQDIRRKGITKVESAEIHLVITALVRGDDNLIGLPNRLQEYTSFTNAWIGENTELVTEMSDTVRATIHLSAPLLLPGFDKAIMHKEIKK
ncbi:MAG: hypothetical protein O3A95_04205 [Planctomycetota bacterium]|nr:hypothetical protein [Planctomycetota bacterium]